MPSSEAQRRRATNGSPGERMLIAEALRLLRGREGLTQVEAAKRAGVPDCRTLSHWETGRKVPGVKLLYKYLRGLDLDFCDLQDAVNELEGPTSTGCRMELEHLARRVALLERQLEVGSGGEVSERDSNLSAH